MSFLKHLKPFLGKLGFFTKPSFIVVGAQKAGTTALYSILEQHSKITPSLYKELHYFDDDILYNKNNIGNYHLKFPLSFQIKKDQILFEASPMYLFHPLAAKRIHNYNPNIKIIIMLRNPVERAFSAWTMYHYHFKTGQYNYLHDKRSFNEAIHEEMSKIDIETFYNNKIAYIKRGIYSYQIEEYLKYFPSKNVFFIESNELKNNFEDTIKDLLKFLNVPYEKIELKEKNKSRVENDSFNETKKELEHFYKPHNEKLYHLINKNYNW